MFLVVIVFFLITGGLTWYMLTRDRGSKEPIGALWAAFGFGVLAMLPVALVEGIFIPEKIDQATVGAGMSLLFYMGVGIVEEAAKFLPLAFFIRKKSYFNEYTDGVIYFALSGLAFGLVENITYTAIYGASTGVWRVAIIPIFHAATMGIVGFYFAASKIEGKSWAKPLAILAALAVMHGLYDFGSDSNSLIFLFGSLMLTLLLTVGFFLYYMRATDLDRKAGKSAVGNNKFCRSCGVPNTNHTLYCEACGKLA